LVSGIPGILGGLINKAAAQDTEVTLVLIPQIPPIPLFLVYLLVGEHKEEMGRGQTENYASHYYLEA
jgi:hypothetical protein